MKKEVLDLDELLAKATHALEERQAAMITLQAANQAGNDPLKSIKLDSGFSSKDLYVENATRYKSLKIDSSKTVLVCEPAHTNAQKNYSSLRTKAHVGPEHLPTRPISHLDSSSLSQGSNGKCMETSGPQWFGIPAPDMTEDLKRDLHIIRSRTVIDPKRHYKKGTMSKLPKFFQVGTIVQGPAEFYSNRLTRKERRNNIVDELLADTEAKTYYKRKFMQIQTEKNDFTRKDWKRRRGKK